MADCHFKFHGGAFECARSIALMALARISNSSISICVLLNFGGSLEAATF